MDFLVTYSKQHHYLALLKRFFSSPVYYMKYVDLVQKMTGCSEIDVLNCLKNNMEIQLYSEDDLRQRLTMLSSLELDDKSNVDRVILVKHHPKTVKHRYLILKEFGFKPSKINSTSITRYLTYAKTKISLLKKRNLLDDATDVTEKMLSFTPLTSSELNCSTSDSNTPDQIKTSIVKLLLTKLVGYSEPLQEEAVLLKRLRHKSILETLRNLHNLEHDVGLSKEKIRNNPFLLSASDVDNTERIMSTFPSIAGVDIKTILNNHPKILASPIESIVKIHQYLNEAEVSDVALSKCFEVFTLNCETVRVRLNECKTHNFFSVHRHHPRILELIMYQNKAKQRLEKLRKIKVDFVSLNTLATSSDKFFDRYFEEGSDRQFGLDTLYFLSEELDCDRELLRKKLQKHPYWMFSSLVTINNNLKALLEKGFTKNHILEHVYILLYPTNLMLDEVDKVCLRKESDVCRNSVGLLSKSYLLPLALYYIEREVNFTGSAIWQKQS